MRRYILTITVGVCLLLAGAELARGAGFEVAELSGRSLGNSYAGKAAAGNDVAIAYFNPAGMTLFTSHAVAIPFHVLRTTGDWDDDGSLSVTGSGLAGGDGGDPGGYTYIPNIYAIYSVNDDIKVGLSVNSPYGLKTDYDDDWQGRYFGTKSELKTININPAVAYRVDEVFSIGLGFSAQYLEATLDNAVDFGTIGFSQLGPLTAGKLGLIPEQVDGDVSLTADDWAFGLNAGILIELSEDTRVGIAWRSRILHQVDDGDVDFTVPAAAKILTQSGAFVDTKASTRIGLPEQAYFSFFHRVNEKWDVLADITWTGWSRFDELKIRFDNEAQPLSVTTYDWNDVVRYAVGAIYRATDKITLRCGGAFDESPIKDKNRTPRIPTDDRWWLTIGGSYQVDENISVDLSYMHVFIKDGDIDLTAETGQQLKGTFTGSADVLALQVNISF